MEKPIGLIIREIIEEKNFRINDLAASMGVSRQMIYNSYGKDRLKRADLEKWSEALGVSVDEMKARQIGNYQTDNNGDAVLQEIHKMLGEELKDKNDQIRALQEALKQSQQLIRESQQLARENQQLAMALLGKSLEYSIQSPVIPYASHRAA